LCAHLCIVAAKYTNGRWDYFYNPTLINTIIFISNVRTPGCFIMQEKL